MIRLSKSVKEERTWAERDNHLRQPSISERTCASSKSRPHHPHGRLWLLRRHVARPHRRQVRRQQGQPILLHKTDGAITGRSSTLHSTLLFLPMPLRTTLRKRHHNPRSRIASSVTACRSPNSRNFCLASTSSMCPSTPSGVLARTCPYWRSFDQETTRSPTSTSLTRPTRDCWMSVV